jgi:hypothetical protein
MRSHGALTAGVPAAACCLAGPSSPEAGQLLTQLTNACAGSCLVRLHLCKHGTDVGVLQGNHLQT